MADGEEVMRCEKCGGPTIHRAGKCQACVVIKKIGALRAKGSFDFVRMLGTGMIIVIACVIVYACVAAQH